MGITRQSLIAKIASNNGYGGNVGLMILANSLILIPHIYLRLLSHLKTFPDRFKHLLTLIITFRREDWSVWLLWSYPGRLKLKDSFLAEIKDGFGIFSELYFMICFFLMSSCSSLCLGHIAS